MARGRSSVGVHAAAINAPILMRAMSALDHSELDGRLLQLLVAVVEERSVTRAAERLGVTQSAVSHLLEKLRAIVGDPVVVKAGRGVVPTVRAEALAQRAGTLLEDLRRFAVPEVFEPANQQGCITLAANELQCDLLLPPLLQQLRQQAPQLALRVIPSAVPQPDWLRGERCQLVISPRPPAAGDLLQRRLFADHYRVFYDAAVRPPPRGLDDYLAAEHLAVQHTDLHGLEVDSLLAARLPRPRRIVATLPGFASIAPLLRGSERLATLPGLLQRESLRGLAAVAPPLPLPEMPMYLIWHARRQSDPAHRWLRALVVAVAEGLRLVPEAAAAAGRSP